LGVIFCGANGRRRTELRRNREGGPKGEINIKRKKTNAGGRRKKKTRTPKRGKKISSTRRGPFWRWEKRDQKMWKPLVKTYSRCKMPGERQKKRANGPTIKLGVREKGIRANSCSPQGIGHGGKRPRGRNRRARDSLWYQRNDELAKRLREDGREGN